MINFKFWKNVIDAKTLEDVAGIKYEGDKEIMMTDLIERTNPEKFQEKKVWIPIRYYNIVLAVHQTLNEARATVLTPDLLRKAFKLSEERFFGLMGEPLNMAKELGATSYKKLMDSAEADLRLCKLQ